MCPRLNLNVRKKLHLYLWKKIEIVIYYYFPNFYVTKVIKLHNFNNPGKQMRRHIFHGDVISLS